MFSKKKLKSLPINFRTLTTFRAENSTKVRITTNNELNTSFYITQPPHKKISKIISWDSFYEKQIF
ncbi:hypothetical protein EGI22_13815 [Lacihabitans sp. LS3-19]|nr:hypothetical protein [Lacihabitans sp. LS3-19]